MHLDDIPILSGANRLVHLGELKNDRLGLFHRFNRECGAIGRLRVLGTSLVLVNSPELLHEVLIDQARSFKKPPGLLGPARPLVGEGLSTSEGELWQRQRKLMAPPFAHARIAQYAACMAECAWSAVLELREGQIGRNPEARARARAEAKGLDGRKPRADDLPRLDYCLRVFKEALRLCPPIYFFAREAATDVRVGDVSLPRGVIVLISPYALHRRPEIWPDPERFEPSRFEPMAERSRHRLSYLPFSAGPRSCIGSSFALMEGPIVLATVLGRVDLDLSGPDPIELEPSATLRPKCGVSMRVTAVDSSALGPLLEQANRIR